MNILLIEDEPKVALNIRQGLIEKDYYVDLSLDGKTGKKLFLTNSYNLVILDIILPDIDGLTLCKFIKEFPMNQFGLW